MCSMKQKSLRPFLEENRFFCFIVARRGQVGKRPGRWFRTSSLGFQRDFDRELSTQPVTRREKLESQECSTCMFVFVKGDESCFLVLALFEGGDEEFDFDEDDVIGNFKRSQAHKEKKEGRSSGLSWLVFIFRFYDCVGSGFIEGEDTDFCFDEASVISKFSQSQQKKEKKKDEDSGSPRWFYYLFFFL